MKEKLGEILLKKKKISYPQLQHALNIQKTTGEKLGEILLLLHIVSEEDIIEALSEQYNIPLWEGNVEKINIQLISKIGLDNCISACVLPVSNGSADIVLINSPNSPETTNFLLSYNLLFCKQYLAPRSIILENLKKIVPKSVRQQKIETEVKKLQEKGVSSGALPLFADFILEEAMIEMASDIHIEPSRETTDIRFRIDGILVPAISLPKLFHDNLVNVFYSRAEINQSEFVKYHDASFSFQFSGRNIDVRLSSIPSTYGASLVLRLLDRNRTIVSLKQLGYRQYHLQQIQKMIKKPEGLVIFTGPTGSGKTTSLYSILSSLRSEETKIITIEDPPEVEIPGVIQCAINPKAGITYANAIRGFLRHDPDIILVGEIRDNETAEECIRATLTGHKTFSTLHTYSATSSIMRLNDLGIGFSYISMVLSGVVNQRLVRKLCPFCKKEVEVPKLYQKFISRPTIYQPQGCEYCFGGYKGRTPVVEVLWINETMRKLIEQGAMKEFEKYLYEKGHKTLFDDAMELVELGITSIEEIERVVGGIYES
jgi:type II secretory ATPase GspE/PulE/Tfp pilus assembly ATPase PilB-like protein